MKSIKIRKDFTLNGKPYFEGDNLESKEFKIEEIINLNEKGFIEPLNQKEIISLINEKENKNNENNENKMFNKSSKIKEGE